jgi:GAF domain-containing protein
MRLAFWHRRRPRRPFEDSDLAVAQFVFLTAALRLWHALDENDERALTRALTRFDRTAASYVDALDKARERARKP